MSQGKLPRVGDFGPGSFMILEYLPLVPFGSMRPETQTALGEQLAAMHLSDAHQDLHQGRYGFPVSNFLSLTPLNNTWTPAGISQENAWVHFFGRRLKDQGNALLKNQTYAPLPKDKAYGRRALDDREDEVLRSIEKVLKHLPELLEDAKPGVSLLHGDLWVGNLGKRIVSSAHKVKDGADRTSVPGAVQVGDKSTKQTAPVIYDPASFFGHSEFELSIMRMFGGINQPFWDAYHAHIPKAKNFDRRVKVYELYHYVNQLNLFGDPSVKATIVKLANELV
eukprot:scaffold2114_cov253-Pinguiococcus_pyrenoidosus.AAC.8